MSFELLIEPHDVLLFRDGRPFQAGEDTRARSLFPPTAFTVQGAIRARVLFSSGIRPAEYAGLRPPQDAQKLHQLVQLIGRPGQGYGQLRLYGPFLARRREGSWQLYFPVPADVIRREDGSWAVLSPLNRSELKIASNLPSPDVSLLWLRSMARVEDSRGWITDEDFQRYLEGKAPEKVYGEETFVIREPRLGIALERGLRTAREAHLYLAEFLRMREDTALWVRLEGITPRDLGGDMGWLQLGGEARVAHYRVQEAQPRDWMPQAGQLLPPRFKVILLTPAWFAGGWQPGGGNWSSFFSGNVRLVAAAVPRYQPLGGAYVDDRRRRKDFQKPMRRFVPAGAVYYFEVEGAEAARWMGQPFTEPPDGEDDFGQIGFGCFAIGTWKYA